MKKIALLFFLLLFLSEIYYLNFKLTDEVQPVNTYLVTEEGLIKYQINFEKVHFTTKEFLSYFNRQKVISITIEIPELLKRKNVSDTYYFDYSSNQNNLARIINQYNNILKKYNFIKEYYLKQYEGIRIKKVIVEMTNEEKMAFEKEHTNITLEPFT